MYKNIRLNLLEKKWKEENYETLEVDISEKVKKLIKIIPKKREENKWNYDKNDKQEDVC